MAKQKEKEKEKAVPSKGAKVEEVTDEEVRKLQQENEKAKVKAVPAPAPVPEAKPAEAPKKAEGEGEDDDKEPPPPGNGGKTDKYVWTQTLSELNLSIPMPANTRSKMLDISFGNKKVRVGIKGQSPIIDGEFPEKIKVFSGGT